MVRARSADQHVSGAWPRRKQRQQMTRDRQMWQQVLVEAATQEIRGCIEHALAAGGAADRRDDRARFRPGQGTEACRQIGRGGVAADVCVQRRQRGAVPGPQSVERFGVVGHRDRAASGGRGLLHHAHSDRPGGADHHQRRWNCPDHGILSPEKHSSTGAVTIRREAVPGSQDHNHPHPARPDWSRLGTVMRALDD
ncbi:hypothetical protein CNR27_02710 [Luteimonas chenhongjianii]|uniref:Uncharacterized protein n=2 Tax=Luteimonas chenhongjianii TaxID=2006110 RepID=A0A290XBZ1_9GAMM|nr:hypothetical protein CNR27_02710 [Luteimonas chenhongjianii]